jgi:hypothetical protein
LTEANTRIGIYLDNQLVGTYANTSGNSALSWKTLNYSFSGDGKPHTLSIQLEGGSSSSPAKGAMIDTLKLVETLPNSASTVYGFEDTAIALPGIAAQLADTDPDGKLRLEMLGLPIGSTLSDGKQKLKITKSTAIDLTGWNLNKLSLTPPSGFDGQIKLQVKATSTETGNGSTASIARDITVQVLEGKSCTTPAGINPYVSFVNSLASSTTSGPTMPLTVYSSPLVPVPQGATASITVAQRSAVDDSDDALETLLAQMGDRIQEALLREMERGLLGSK